MKDRVESLKRARHFTADSLFGETPPTRPPAYSAAPRPARGGPTIRLVQYRCTILNNLVNH